LRRLFEPLGYAISAQPLVLDEQFPDWGESHYFDLTLSGTMRVRDLLAHLCVLIPVLDDRKHYFVGDDEVEKLLRRGEGWLTAHPERDLITRRYLKHRRDLVRDALECAVREQIAQQPTLAAAQIEDSTGASLFEARDDGCKTLRMQARRARCGVR